MKDLIACLYSEGYTFGELKKLSSWLIQPECSGSFFSYCKQKGISYLVGEEVFLKKTKNPPFVLYYKWNLDLLHKKIIWIVWPRKITPFIKQALEKFFEFLHQKDVVIVSGFAPGTDQYAHSLALKYNLPTIAVLWFGFKKAFESPDRKFLAEIVESWGLLLSEFRLNQAGTTWTFPQRNRIIAGLSDFLFVPQAAYNSWTLITVEDALKINVPVYSCFSHYLDESWQGTNQLIQKGQIKGIYDWKKFLREISQKYNFHTSLPNTEVELTPKEKEILKFLKMGKNSLEELVIASQLEIGELLNILSSLELKWVIYETVWNYFVK